MFTHVRVGCVIQIEDLTRDVSDVTHRKRGLRFEKSQLVEIETWARPDEFVL